MTLFGWVADRVPDEPLSVCRSTIQPAVADFEGQFRVVFGDVAEMVGHAPSNVQIRVVLDCFKNGQHRAWILDEGWDTYCPRQARAGSF